MLILPLPLAVSVALAVARHPREGGPLLGRRMAAPSRDFPRFLCNGYELKKNHNPSFRSPAALGSLFLACPKKSNQKKGQFPDKSIPRLESERARSRFAIHGSALTAAHPVRRPLGLVTYWLFNINSHSKMDFSLCWNDAEVVCHRWRARPLAAWIPAFAGMTSKKMMSGRCS
ncbi:hypothetical protein L3D22_08160 [Lysobacter soli]|uniref:hypothetical protein n=1 Tax=Lysobacter soli TaxID=453783 RepID=UPI00209DF3AA|nr:hypothetical protein [Lysobacter soli]UTA55753.1 hypothetical protein L3D22_08160 [Lysobacter soli]